MKPMPAMFVRFVTLLLALAVTACSASGVPAGGSADSSSTEPPAQITVGLTQPIFVLSALYVAQEKGFWADENLKVELTAFGSGTDNQQAILGDVVTIGAGGYTEPLTLAAQGVPAEVIGVIDGTLPYTLISRPEIADVTQVQGKVFAVSKVGSLSDQITRILLNKKGVDPDTVKIQQAGNSAARLAALESGAVDVALLSAPEDKLALDAGMKTLISARDAVPGFAYEVLYAKKSSIDANRDAFVRFMKGYIRAAQYFTDPANKDDVLKITANALNQDIPTVQLSYDALLQDVSVNAEVNLDGIQLAVDGVQKFGELEGADKLTADDISNTDIQKEALAALGSK